MVLRIGIGCPEGLGGVARPDYDRVLFASRVSAMLCRLDVRDAVRARAIHRVLQDAYREEAVVLGVRHFPPLSRGVRDIAASAGTFHGFLAGNELLGVIEVEEAPGEDGRVIASLAVAPRMFRRGIGRALVEYVIAAGDGPLSVSTGAANGAAIGLYEKLGFILTRRYATPEGIPMVELVRPG
ncbi:MAG: GNAT family N-acetyltransferase [Gammaproteobacteria bacterium]